MRTRPRRIEPAADRKPDERRTEPAEENSAFIKRMSFFYEQAQGCKIRIAMNSAATNPAGSSLNSAGILPEVERPNLPNVGAFGFGVGESVTSASVSVNSDPLRIANL